MTQGYCSTYLHDHESVLGVHPEGHYQAWGEEDERKDIVAGLPVLGKPSTEKKNLLPV